MSGTQHTLFGEDLDITLRQVSQKCALHLKYLTEANENFDHHIC